ncbi:Ubiquinone/menaquinone biosynthesis methyltransferase ubiE [Rickettsiales bacterium Ac37b]|nr:Ubiquinone/menaquinone biosynthesis methyltransferase ubiE [Rickettsiales bacterium Ac37b]
MFALIITLRHGRKLDIKNHIDPAINVEYTHFGYQQVKSSAKPEMVNHVFNSVANKYDLMNDIMSFGLHRLWKQRMLQLLPNYNASLLDVAGGTADISMLYYKYAKQNNCSPNITICDINYKMLEFGRDKLINNSILSGINFVCGNAEKLPIDDMTFDYYTIAFGIRNTVDISSVLKEAYRVLKPGGKFVCLEFSEVNNRLLSSLYDYYSFNIIPLYGKIFAQNQEAYQYLVESIRNFPNQKTFALMIEKVGFKFVNYHNLNHGITALHYGYRI